VTAKHSPSSKHLGLLITVSALGYFVDVYDLLLFSVVRKQSLLDMGVADADTLAVGLRLLNWQMAGILLGGFVWGMVGDKRGRLSVLFGSIILYSIANLANGFAHSVGGYEVWRFVAGFGLAGELGAGVTLVSECMSAERRGLGTMLIATVGVPGAIFAAWVGQTFKWQTAYLIGGGMGLLLLLLRVGLYESGLYHSVRQANVARGSLPLLFRSPARVYRFLLCILAGLPAYLVIGILITYAPEFGKAMNLNPVPVAGAAITLAYTGLTIGGLLCNGLSQIIRRRRAAMIIFHLLGLVSTLVYLYWTPLDLTGFYARCLFLGIGVGFWALMVTNAAEQFGTNLRATVTTAVPNLVRGALIPISWAFAFARDRLGIIDGAALVGCSCVVIAIIAVALSRETFGRSLDFLEE
jgi:MFS transporter, putative metabolite:H+ symporter